MHAQARRSAPTRAFTRSELVLTLAALAMIALALAPAMATDTIRSSRVVCANNLKHIGRALASWAADHDEKYPWQVNRAYGGTAGHSDVGRPTMQFLAISNELVTPAILVCAADAGKSRAHSFEGFWPTSPSESHVSYMLSHPDVAQGRTVLSGDRNVPGTNGSCPVFQGATVVQPASATWNARVHVYQGNVLFNDGSVEGTDNASLRAAFATVGPTNAFHFIAPGL